MKGGLLVKQLHRLLSLTTVGECRPVSFFNDGGVRGMATSTEILLSSSKSQETVAEFVDKRPTIRSYNAEKVRKAPTSPPQPRWYRPDPVTGTWLPESSTESSVISPSLISRIRAESTEDKRWWTSMEELPDMDRHKDL